MVGLQSFADEEVELQQGNSVPELATTADEGAMTAFVNAIGRIRHSAILFMEKI